MSLTETPVYGNLNGATPVSVIPAPSATHRYVVVAGTIFNADTAAVTVTLRYKVVSGGATFVIFQVTLQPGDSLDIERSDAIVLTPTEGLEVVMSGAAATTNPQYRFAYGDVQ